MPLGLWKCKWEIHREDMTGFWAETDRRPLRGTEEPLELVELKTAVNAQTEAILKLVDRFEEWERRQAA